MPLCAPVTFFILFTLTENEMLFSDRATPEIFKLWSAGPKHGLVKKENACSIS
jgi:hypothetical protein